MQPQPPEDNRRTASPKRGASSAAAGRSYLHRRQGDRRRSERRSRSWRSLFWHPERGWHFSFVARVGLAIGLMSIVGALLLASLSVKQHVELLGRQSAAFGQTIVEQLAGSLVEPVFTDDFLGIQLQLNQLVSQQMVHGAAVYFPNGHLMAQSGSIDILLPPSTIRQRDQSFDTVAATSLQGNFEQSAAEQVSAPVSQAQADVIQFENVAMPFAHYRAPVKFSGANGAYAVVSLNRSPLSVAFATSSRNVIAAVIIICAISLFGAYWVSRWLSRPIYQLLSISEDAKKGRVSELDKKHWRNEWADISSVYAQLGEEVNSKRSVEKLLHRFVASDVAEELLSGDDVFRLDGESVTASVLFVDIVEFTSISETMRPADVAKMLNRYLSIFASCARIYRGTVDKFIGDAAMIVFGSPRPDAQHRQQALTCAALIQDVARQLNEKRREMGLAPINLRIGINTGTMQAGVLGSEYRMEYTVVGDAVNVASRLCDAAKPGEILLAESVYQPSAAPKVRVSGAGTIDVKGKEGSVSVYRLESTGEQRSLMVSSLIEDLLSA